MAIGKGSIIHPHATINARNGPIIIGNDNLFEVGCDVRAKQIGSFCIIGIQSTVSSDIILKDGIILAARSNLSIEDVDENVVTIPEKTSIYGENSEIWRKMKEMPQDN